MSSKAFKAIGEDIWKKTDKINLELFVLTYGSLVSQLLKEHENDYNVVNKQLDKMGYNIGTKLIDDFFAKCASMFNKCQEFKETVEVISKVAFKIYLGITPTISNFSKDGKSCSLILDENPLIEFVDAFSMTSHLSPAGAGNEASGGGSIESDVSSNKLKQPDGLCYCQVYCGIIRGALEMIQLQVECTIVNDTLVSGSPTEIRINFIDRLKDVPIDF